jgi:hypothetical protein
VVCIEEEVVMDSTGSIDKLNAPLTLFAAASATVTEKLYDPEDPTGGVPLRSPALERFKKLGSPVTVQV